MTSTDRRKQSLHFSESMLDEIRFEAARLDRSMSWLVQRAWKIARDLVMAMPSANDAPAAGGGVNVADESGDVLG